LEPNWRSSTSCDTASCVEVLLGDTEVQVRDSKDPTGSTLTFTVDEWVDFVDGVKSREFDIPT